MAYCPQCGREQRCGCDQCHRCGVALVERPSGARVVAGPPDRTAGKSGGDGPAQAPSVSRSDEGPATGDPRLNAAASRDGLAQTARRSRDRAGSDSFAEFTRRVLPALLVLMGAAALAIVAVDIVNNLNKYIGGGGAAYAGDPVRRLGYILGGSFYTASVRILLSFAAIGAGLFSSPPRPFNNGEAWRRAVIALGLLMGFISLCSLVSVALIGLPGLGNEGLLVRNLLPSLAAAIPVLLIIGISLLFAGYIVTRRVATFSEVKGSFSEQSAAVRAGSTRDEGAGRGAGKSFTVGGRRRSR